MNLKKKMSLIVPRLAIFLLMLLAFLVFGVYVPVKQAIRVSFTCERHSELTCTLRHTLNGYLLREESLIDVHHVAREGGDNKILLRNAQQQEMILQGGTTRTNRAALNLEEWLMLEQPDPPTFEAILHPGELDSLNALLVTFLLFLLVGYLLFIKDIRYQYDPAEIEAEGPYPTDKVVDDQLDDYIRANREGVKEGGRWQS